MEKNLLDVIYIRINVFLIILSSYILTVTIVYTLRKLKNDLKKENIVVSVCAFCAFLCSVLIAVVKLKDLYNNNDKLFCTFVGINLIINVAVSKTLCNIVFAYRYKMINKSCSSLAAKRAYLFTFLIIVLSVIGLISNIYFWIYKVRQPCKNGQINESNYAFGFFILGNFVIGTFFQTIILVEIIRPLFKHHMNMSRATIPNDQIKNLLCRVIVCTLNFCITDVALIIYGFIKHKGREFSLLVELNLLINATSLICSYTDYKKRLFPFLRWNTSKKHHIRTHRVEKSKRSCDKDKPSLFTLFEDRRNVENQNQITNDYVFKTITQSNFSNINPVLHETKSFELPEIKNQRKSTNFVINETEESVNKTFSSYEATKPINFVNKRKTSHNERKFLSFVPRRKNLKEFETTV